MAVIHHLSCDATSQMTADEKAVASKKAIIFLLLVTLSQEMYLAKFNVAS